MVIGCSNVFIIQMAYKSNAKPNNVKFFSEKQQTLIWGTMFEFSILHMSQLDDLRPGTVLSELFSLEQFSQNSLSPIYHIGCLLWERKGKEDCEPFWDFVQMVGYKSRASPPSEEMMGKVKIWGQAISSQSSSII